MNTLDQTNRLGLTEQVDCEELCAVLLALKTQIVFCDTLKGKHIPVRNARAFKVQAIPSDLTAAQWTDRNFLGKQKGFEVLTLEGWSVPERVYYVAPAIKTPAIPFGIKLKIGTHTPLFIGKVIVLNGSTVFYRSGNFTDFYSYTLKALSTDRAVMDYAIKAGARQLVIYCKDTRQLFTVPVESVSASAVTDLGARPQYRIDLKLSNVIVDTHAPATPYIEDSNTVIVH